MKKAQIIIDKYFLTGKEVSGFSVPLLNSWDALFMKESIRRAARCLTSRAFVKILWNW